MSLSPAYYQMVLCITREPACTPKACLKCGWLLDDVHEALIKDQEEWLKDQELSR